MVLWYWACAGPNAQLHFQVARLSSMRPMVWWLRAFIFSGCASFFVETKVKLEVRWYSKDCSQTAPRPLHWCAELVQGGWSTFRSSSSFYSICYAMVCFPFSRSIRSWTLEIWTRSDSAVNADDFWGDSSTCMCLVMEKEMMTMHWGKWERWIEWQRSRSLD